MIGRTTRRRNFGSNFSVDKLERRQLLSGNLDPTFGTGGFLQGPAAAGEPQYNYTSAQVDSAGRLLIAADVGSSEEHVVLFRFLTTGALDTSFGSNGSVVFGQGSGVTATWLAQTPAGEIFVATQQSLYEISSTGVFNTAFGTGGTITPPDAGKPSDNGPADQIIALVADGNNVLVGEANDAVLRYQPDGTLDPTFGSAGVLNSPAVFKSLVVTPAGKLAELIGAEVYQFNSDGSIDTSFGQSGHATEQNVYSILPQVGSAGQLYLQTIAGGVYRINSDGSTDSTFTPVSTGDDLFAIESDGTVLSTQNFQQFPTITHYGTNGLATGSSARLNSGVAGLLSLAGGKYIAVTSPVQAVQFTADNIPDTSFGSDGSLTAARVAQPPPSYTSIVTQSDRKVIVGGLANGPSGQVIELTRYNVDGSLDSSFGAGGTPQFVVDSEEWLSISLLIEPNGQILVAGNLGSSALYNPTPGAIGITRFNADGTDDSTFGTSGTAFIRGDESPTLLWQNGQILVGTPTSVHRLNADGTVDESFPTTLRGGSAFAVQSDGKILVDVTTVDTVGNNPTTSAIYRYNADGTVDSAFGSNGKANSAVAATDNPLTVDQLLVESHGTIIAVVTRPTGYEVGVSNPYQLLALNTNGSVDSSFATSGTLSLTFAVGHEFTAFAPALIQQSDGKLLFATAQHETDGPYYTITQRYSATGVADTSYGTGGTSTLGSPSGSEFRGGGPVDIENIAALDSAGRLLLTGGAGPALGPNIFAVDTSGSAVTGPAAKLVVLQQPAALSDGTVTSVFLVEDVNGSLISTDASSVTITLSGGAAGTALTGTTTMTSDDGFAIWGAGDVYLLVPGNSYTLTATDPGLTSVTSSTFAIPTPFGFAKNPLNANTNTSPGPVVVDVLNADGTIDTTSHARILLTLGNADAGATLNGTTVETAVNGVATFSDLSIITAGSGYTLTASFNDQTSALVVSAPFNISNPSALTPTLANVKFPTTVIIGSRFVSRIPVEITNSSAGVMKGIAKVNIYADRGVLLDGTAVLLGSTRKKIGLCANQRTSPTLTLRSLPANFPAGTYHLMVQVIDPSGSKNTVTATQTVTVATPFVRPVVALASVTPATVDQGKFGSILITITNSGNVAGRGLRLSLALSVDGKTPVAGKLLASLTSGDVILAGAARRFHIRFKVTASTPAGMFYPYLTATLGKVTTTAVGNTVFMIR